MSPHPRALAQVVALAAAILLMPRTGKSQISSEQAGQLRSQTGTRIEALTILGGDF